LPWTRTTRALASLALAAPLGAGLCLRPAAAGPLTNTLQDTNAGLAAGSVDSAWTVYDITQSTALTAYAVIGYNGIWTASGTTAGWDAPVVGTGGNAGTYNNTVNDYISYTQTFNLTSNGAAAPILGYALADNAIVGIIINGITVFGTASPTGNGTGSFTYANRLSFDIVAADLINGSNTIEFLTVNYPGTSGNPTGLYVDFTSVPEPPALAVLGAAMVLTAGLRRAPRRAGVQWRQPPARVTP